MKKLKEVNQSHIILYIVTYFIDSDEDEESISGYLPEQILEPKDQYALRPLPVRIGTPSFFYEDDVGLGDYASDEG